MQHEVHNRVLERLARFHKTAAHTPVAPPPIPAQQMRLNQFPVLFDLAHDQPRITSSFFSPAVPALASRLKLQLRFANVAMSWPLVQALARRPHRRAARPKGFKPPTSADFAFNQNESGYPGCYHQSRQWPAIAHARYRRFSSNTTRSSLRDPDRAQPFLRPTARRP